MIAVRKIKLTVINENEEIRKQQYQFIRDSQYAQYRGLNKAVSFLATSFYNGGFEQLKEAKKQLTNSSPIFEEIEFGKGIDSKSAITQRVKKDFSNDLKNGLAKGERSVRNYKRTYPLITRGRDLKFYYDEDTDDVYIKWVNHIVFKAIMGEKIKNSLELKHSLHKVIDNEYKVNESSLEFDKNNNLMINLNLTIPDNKEIKFVDGRTLGVDLGIAIPAYVSLNDIEYVRKGIGSASEFFKVRTQMNKRRERLYKQLQASKGGRGRKDKLKGMDQLREKERNFVKTYNHFISTNIINFAKKNKCQYINLEKLEKDGFGERLLRNWSYYELQNMIEYKAERDGIKVRYINPAYTSQKCSKCEYIDKENRETQETFICKSCGFEANADYNASRNIAKSTDFKKD